MDSTIYAALPWPRPRPWNSSAVHQFICITFSFFSRKTFKAQHKSVLLFIPRCYVGEALSTAQQSCQLVLGLTANPPKMSSGLEIIREHSHLAEPDIRHILFSTRSLPHFTTCLHSNPRQQDTIRGWQILDNLRHVQIESNSLVPAKKDAAAPLCILFIDVMEFIENVFN